MAGKWAREPADMQTNYLSATYGTVFSSAGRASLHCLMTLKLEQLKVYKEARLESTWARRPHASAAHIWLDGVTLQCELRCREEAQNIMQCNWNNLHKNLN